MIILVDSNVPESIISDSKRYKQIIFNLISNAIKFTFIGYIKMKVCYNQDEDVLITEIEDTGIGIKEED